MITWKVFCKNLWNLLVKKPQVTNVKKPQVEKGAERLFAR